MRFFPRWSQSQYQPVSGSDNNNLEELEAVQQSPGLSHAALTGIPDKHDWFSLVYFSFSLLCFVAGIWSFLDQQGHRISDDKCLQVMSAPSMPPSHKRCRTC